MPKGVYIRIPGRRKPHSKETIEKMSRTKTGKPHPNLHMTGIRRYNFIGFKISSENYVLVYRPSHPHCDKKGYVRLHRLVIEKHIGRYLMLDEDVHHINGDTLDNRVENLQLISHGDHTRMTLRNYWYRNNINNF